MSVQTTHLTTGGIRERERARERGRERERELVLSTTTTTLGYYAVAKKNVSAWKVHDFAFTLGYGITLKKSQNSLPLTV